MGTSRGIFIWVDEERIYTLSSTLKTFAIGQLITGRPLKTMLFTIFKTLGFYSAMSCSIYTT